MSWLPYISLFFAAVSLFFAGLSIYHSLQAQRIWRDRNK